MNPLILQSLVNGSAVNAVFEPPPDLLLVRQGYPIDGLDYEQASYPVPLPELNKRCICLFLDLEITVETKLLNAGRNFLLFLSRVCDRPRAEAEENDSYES